MAIYSNPTLDNLSDPALIIAVAEETHNLAKYYESVGQIPKYFFSREIYEPATEKTLPNGETYREISFYSDGFGTSLFIKGNEMLFLGSDHEISAEGAIDGDRDSYLTPLLKGLPAQWDFVVDMLQTQDRFEWNPPASVFWFKDGQWNVTDNFDEIINSGRDSFLGDYKDGVESVPTAELGAIFAHGGRNEVDPELIKDYLRVWFKDLV